MAYVLFIFLYCTCLHATYKGHVGYQDIHENKQLHQLNLQYQKVLNIQYSSLCVNYHHLSLVWRLWQSDILSLSHSTQLPKLQHLLYQKLPKLLAGLFDKIW